MSCRHDLANESCKRCYPDRGTVDPGGPPDDPTPGLEGPGSIYLCGHANEVPIQVRCLCPETCYCRGRTCLTVEAESVGTMLGATVDGVKVVDPRATARIWGSHCFPQWATPAPKVRVKRWGTHDLPPPGYKTAGAAGMDLHARLAAPPGDWTILHPGARLVVGCGWAFEIPPGWEGQVRPRSGLARDHGLVCAFGTVDSDYRGEVGCNLFNLGREAVKITHGDRVAQLVIAPAPQVRVTEVAELSTTARGEAGFGSTGK